MTRMTLLGKRRAESQKGNRGIVGKGALLAGSSPGLSLHMSARRLCGTAASHLLLSKPPRSLLLAKYSGVYSTATSTHPTPSLDKAQFFVAKIHCYYTYQAIGILTSRR